MTREEAIKYLIHPFVDSTDVGKEKQKELDAYNMAIKALEQEPCEDVVSRAEVLKGYIEIQRADGMEIYSDKAVPTEYINNLPPVTPQPKTGHWITVEMTQDDGCRYTVTYCSECDEDVDYRTDYCPNCGAKMVEPQESEVKE